MRAELWIILITTALMYNAYHDGVYSKMIHSNMKYIKIGLLGLGGFMMYLFFKRHPSESQSMLKHAADIVKYMPIDKHSKDLVTPFLDFTNNASFFSSQQAPSANQSNIGLTPQMKRMMNSGGSKTTVGPESQQRVNRSVSETKKKFVASKQNWACGHCHAQLEASFEVDHITDLQYGGTNEVSNLVALCRNCHGKKTTMSKLYNS